MKEVTCQHNESSNTKTLLEIRSSTFRAMKEETEVLSYGFQLIISGARAKY